MADGGAAAFERNIRADAARRSRVARNRKLFRAGDLAKAALAFVGWSVFVVLLADGCSQIAPESDEFRQERQFEEFGY